MLNDILVLNKKHENAAKTIYERIKDELTDKYIISISGEVETGKAEVAHMLGKLFRKEGIRVKLLHMDNYYRVAPLDRTAWRKRHSIESIGYDEYDWEVINRNLKGFKDGKLTTIPCVDLFTGQIDQLTTNFESIQVLIVDGLYSVKIEEANLKVFIESTYHKTLEEQKLSEKEEMDEFRMLVLEREHTVVQSLKTLADFYLDFETANEIFLN